MANYSAVKATVNAYIKQNGRKEITGKVLNAVLNATIDSLGKYFQFAGGALPTDDPGTPDQNVCYLAGEPGVYTNFGGITIENEEVALLFWNGEWTKQRILIGIREVNASVDNQVGTPSVDVSYSGGELVLTFHNLKGEPGDTGYPAGFGTIGADINGGVGTPGVSVETSGDNTAKNLMFHFTNLKGETGVTSVVATIDDTSGTPSCQVSLVGQQLTLAFSGLKGLKGDTGVSADYPITIYNGLDSDATDQALSAAQGKLLDGKVSQLGQEVDGVTGNLTKDSYLKSNGTLGAESGYSVSDYIPVPAGSFSVYFSNSVSLVGKHLVFFNDSDEVVGYQQENVAAGGMGVSIPSGATKFRFTFVSDYASARVVYSGNTVYEPIFPISSLEQKCKDYTDTKSAILQNEIDNEEKDIAIVLGAKEEKVITWDNGVVRKNGTIATSTLSKFTQPFQLKKGETLFIGTRNSYICIIGTTSSNSLSIGDSVTVLQATGADVYSEYSFTAPDDMKVVLCVRWSEYNLSFRDVSAYSIIPNKVKELSKEVDGVCNFTEGVYLKSDGSLVTETGFAVSDFINAPAGNITINYSNGTSLAGKYLVFYDDANNVVGYQQENVSAGSLSTTTPSGATKFRFTFVSNYGTAQAKSLGQVLYVPVFAEGLVTKVGTIEEKVNGIPGNAIGGVYLNYFGNIVEESGYGVSDFIQVPSGNFTVYYSDGALSGKYLIFYDANGAFVSRVNLNVSGGGATLSIPSGATQFRFSFNSNYENVRAVYSGTVFYMPTIKSLSIEQKCKEYTDSKLIRGNDELMFTLIDDDFTNITMCERLRALCNTLDIKCTFALIPDYSEQDPYTPTMQQEKLNIVQDFLEDGFSFAMHPNHNLFYMDGENSGTVSECEKCLVRTQQFFEEKKILGGSKILVWPGDSDTRTIDGVFGALIPIAKRHIEIAIHAGTYSGKYYNTANDFKSSRYQLVRMPIDFGVFTKTQMKANIDSFVANGAGLMIFNCHVWQYVNDDTTVDETTKSWPNFAEVLTYAANKGIQFVNMNEVMMRKIYTQYMPDLHIVKL